MNLVDAAYARAEASGFPLSCERPVGRLLAALAAGVRPGGNILELGTGAGVGVAWLVSGLGERTDVTVTSVELDPETATVAATEAWPSFVDLRGILAVDDIRPGEDRPEEFKVRQDGVRRTLVEHPHLVSVELDHGSGMVLSTRR